jgi:hypothetical protein
LGDGFAEDGSGNLRNMCTIKGLSLILPVSWWWLWPGHKAQFQFLLYRCASCGALSSCLAAFVCIFVARFYASLYWINKINKVVCIFWIHEAEVVPHFQKKTMPRFLLIGIVMTK